MMTRPWRPGAWRSVTFFLAVSAINATALAAPPPMQVHFIDVGQGDATLFEFPCAAVLVDAGGELNPAFDGREALIDYLEAFFAARPHLARTFALVALTHPHKDHTLGVTPLLRKGFRVKNAVTNGQMGGSGAEGQKALDDHASLQKIPHRKIIYPRVADVAARSDSVIDPVDCTDPQNPSTSIDPKIQIFWGRIVADPGWGNDSYGDPHHEEKNNHSLVIRVNYGDASVLLTGDLEEVALGDLIAQYGSAKDGPLDVDVYQVGHHGSLNGTTEPLLKAMTPQVSVLSMGPVERECQWWWKFRGFKCFTAHQHGHPRERIVRWLDRHTLLYRDKPDEEPVAVGQWDFKLLEVKRCVHATGWSGTVILSMHTNGDIDIIEPGPCRKTPPPP